MTAEDFTAWVAHMKDWRGCSAVECAQRLGCGKNQIARWKRTGAPRYIALACMTLDQGLGPWRA